MAVQFTSEQSLLSENALAGPYVATSSEALIAPTHEYELNQSESLNFLYNLLYDEESTLSRADILSILNAFQQRESSLPFSFENTVPEKPDASQLSTDIQGIKWPPGLRRSFLINRSRIGHNYMAPNCGWFFNIPRLRDKVQTSINISEFSSLNDYFQYKRYYGKLRLHITHFQLRNLVCCGLDLSKGIYYPLSYYQEAFTFSSTSSTDDEMLDYGSNFFRINRLAPDGGSFQTKEPMKLDCIVDSSSLRHNSNSRISTLTCSNDILVCGTFEGGVVLVDVRKSDDTSIIGEYQLTSKEDGITNHVLISKDNKKLVVCSNDRHLREVDVEMSLRRLNTTNSYKFAFAINCLAINGNNENEMIFCGDDINSYILDTRTSHGHVQTLQGHQDYGFCCDWSPTNENLVVTGNQDGTIKLWDRRNVSRSTYTWDSSFGRPIYEGHSKSGPSSTQGAPVRNTKFSRGGEYIAWAECLDHIGLIPVQELILGPDITTETVAQLAIPGVQSIEFVGKCTGINFASAEDGYGEEMIVGVHDCPLGGVLSYKLKNAQMALDFDL